MDTVDTELDRLICKRASQGRRPAPDEHEEKARELLADEDRGEGVR